MRKGHLILGIIVLILMLVLPAFAVKSDTGSSDNGSSPHSASSSVSYSDSFLVLESETGNVKEYSAEEYIFGVLSCEASPEWPEEALKAQAVAAYSLACQRRETRKQNQSAELKGADVSDSGSSDQYFMPKEKALEKWADKADEFEKKLTAVIQSVSGKKLMYNGEYAETVYHAISGGRTESAENVWGKVISYLVPVQSAGDLVSPGYCSSVTVSDSDFLTKLRELSSDSGIEISDNPIGNINTSDSGTVLSIELCSKSFSGKDIRSAFSLNSANFDISHADSAFTFTVRGNGHLVGMSQNGAVEMAKQGGSYSEILAWYYPGTVLSD